MKTPRFDLAWKIPAAGFRWTKAVPAAAETGRPKIALVVDRSPDAEEARGAPPEEPHPVLFRLFCETPADPDGILAFANRHGNLTDAEKVTPVARGKAASPGSVAGVFLESWQRQ